jgi:hypothetical protein
MNVLDHLHSRCSSRSEQGTAGIYAGVESQNKNPPDLQPAN